MFRNTAGASVFALAAVLSPPAFADRLEFICKPAEGKGLTVWTQKIGGEYPPSEWSDDSVAYDVRLRIDTKTNDFEVQTNVAFGDTDWQNFVGQGWLATASVVRAVPRYVTRVRVENGAATAAYVLTFSGEPGAPGTMVFEYDTLGPANISGLLMSSCTVSPWP